jgi:deoxycytidine triphosphate deaminase
MIGTVELLKMVKENKLVENLCERELKNPEGAGFDLRAGEFFKLKEGDAFLGENDRHTPETESVAKYGKDKEIIIKPGEYFLVKTIERVNLPFNVSAIFRPRSTLYRCGLMLATATASPGYSGELIFGICNVGNNDVRIELGARIVHILFFRSGENVSAYRGQWQGGRVSTEGKIEKQV